jgi:hypothetical protein
VQQNSPQIVVTAGVELSVQFDDTVDLVNSASLTLFEKGIGLLSWVGYAWTAPIGNSALKSRFTHVMGFRRCFPELNLKDSIQGSVLIMQTNNLSGSSSLPESTGRLFESQVRYTLKNCTLSNSSFSIVYFDTFQTFIQGLGRNLML